MKQQDAIALLKADHKTVKALFAEAEGLSDRAKMQLKKLGDRICAELTIHEQIETDLLYRPALERAGRDFKEERELLFESLTEQETAKHLIEELQATEAGDETYKPKLNVLKEMVLHHATEEERELWPGLREIFDEDELVEIGARIKAMKERATRGASVSG